MTEPSTPLADLLLHPVRWRITQRALGREVTTTDLKAELPDIPVTTLYRHVAALIEGGVLTVVRERKIRGTTERTLTLDQATGGRLSDAEARAMSPDQHRQAFLLLLTALAADFDRMLARGDLADHIHQLSYSQLALYVDDDDLTELRNRILAAFRPYLDEQPGKQRVTWSLFSLPDT
ncbi:helix-turn-helix domain-containing protein [Kribbella sandramycini]|uniref:Helix-turn-helix domain-containing protein n=1 Tax=Kribbella sandramycini TaxID=60450 RepID=A0A7Y4P199_9ACTN|nr:helix-turn-helix domain-containing protein [Kribbella sandramycini]MBB6570896.1 hypothetical protein [Kribbella sandramycini]NOL44027.1 helix-turn-helix domain-containing protein [Kribbella sandramycini]